MSKRNSHHTRRPDEPVLFETGDPTRPGAYQGRVIVLPDGRARYTVPAPPRTGPDPQPEPEAGVPLRSPEGLGMITGALLGTNPWPEVVSTRPPRSGPDPRAADLARARDEEGAGA